jgi:outer membrane usher protein
VRVYLDNREAGRTDDSGYLLVPGLRPYEANKVRLEVKDLPIDATLGNSEAVAVPYDRSGMIVDFDVRQGGTATATLRDGASRMLPAGLRLASADGAVTVLVARDGFAQVEGAKRLPARVEGGAGGRPYACDLPAAPDGELVPDLGGITCE